MMNKFKNIGLLILISSFLMHENVFAGDSSDQKTDSLKNELKTQQNPIEKAKILINLARNSVSNDLEGSLNYINQGIETIGNRSDSLLCRLHNFKAGIYQRMTGKGKQAIQNYLKALRLAKKTKDSLLIGSICYDFGVFNVYHGDTKMAEKYFLESKAYSFEKSDIAGKTRILISLGFIYSNADEFLKADKVMISAYYMSLKANDKKLIALCASNLAENKWSIGQQDSAFFYINRALKMNEEIDYDLGIAWCNYVYGRFYFKQKKYSKANQYISKAVDIWEILNSYKDLSKYGYLIFAKTKAKLGDYKAAFEISKKLMASNDTISSQRNAEFLTEMEKKYQAEKDSLSLLALNLKLDKEKIKSEKSRQSKRRLIVFFSIIGIILMANAIYFFIRLKATRRTNKIIEDQNISLETKNKEISDSITYAKRIQEAILPSRYSLTENLHNGFVLFRPKDIVSGDFYWLEKVGSATYFAAADCTGHGVPGAMVSVVCANALSKALLEENIFETGKLLDKTRDLVIEKFQNSDEDVKDGMDISLCKLEGNNLQWSGANNPLWLIRKGTNEVEEISGDKQAIGKTDNKRPFTTHNLTLNEGDAFYVFTDGYADQFGGEKGKKFKYKPMQKLLLSIQNKGLEEQKKSLSENFDTWKGNLEQIDDVCIIGIRI